MLSSVKGLRVEEAVQLTLAETGRDVGKRNAAELDDIGSSL